MDTTVTTHPNAAAWARAREIQEERARAAHAATRIQALKDRHERKASGFDGREGYVAWSAETRECLYASLDGQTVPVLLSRVETTTSPKRGTVTTRCTLTGRLTVAGHEVMVKGEANVRDVASLESLDGASLDVKLLVKRNSGGKILGFSAETVGVSSSGARIGVKGTLTVVRYVRVAVSAL